MLIDTPHRFEAFLHDLATQSTVAYDVETSGLDIWGGDRICGIALGFLDGRTFYLPMRHALSVPHVEFERVKTGRGNGSRRVRVERDTLVEREFEQLSPKVIKRLFSVIHENNIELVMHNAKFDIHMTMNEGVDFDGIVVRDTMVMAKLANNLEPTTKLKSLAVKYVDAKANEQEQELKRTLKERGWAYRPDGARRDVMHYDWMTPAEIADYAEQDTAITLALFRQFQATIQATDQRAVYDRETELLPVLVAMERAGIAIDRDYCRKTLAVVEARLSVLCESIYSIAGDTFDIASPAQVGAVLRRLGLHSSVRTPAGKESWNKKALLCNSSLIVDLIQEWRALEKTRTTYLLNYLEFADSDGVIHADIQQLEAKTGRTSYRDPNLQQVTAKDNYGVDIRRCFVPRPGRVFVLIDWKQMEARIIADWAGESWLIDAMNAGHDVHEQMALRIAEARAVEACGDLACAGFTKQRKAAKIIFFGLLYGMGINKLASDLQISEDEAMALRSSFWEAAPNIAKFARNTRNEAGRRGWVTNRYGRRYVYPLEIDPVNGRQQYAYAHAAVDHKIQGTGADMAKIAMIRIHTALKAAHLRSRLLLFVHDEVAIECPPDEVDRVIAGVRRIMGDFKDVFQCVTFPVDVAIAEKSWADERPYTAVSSAA